MEEHKKHEIVLFLIYAFTIPLLCVGLMKIISPYDASGVVTTIIFGIEAASPALSAIIVMLQLYGVSGLKNFLREKYIKDFSIKFCLLGFATPLTVLTIAKLITYLTPYNNAFLNGLGVKKIIIVMWALVAEELGWRGFLQERLEKRIPTVCIPIIIGLIWSAWHYHFFIIGSMEVPIFIFIFGCVAESFGYYIITKAAKGNVIPASLWHFSGNLMFNIFCFNADWNGGSVIPYMIANGLYLLYVVAFVWFYKLY